MAMIAITTSSSIKVKPNFLRVFLSAMAFTVPLSLRLARFILMICTSRREAENPASPAVGLLTDLFDIGDQDAKRLGHTWLPPRLALSPVAVDTGGSSARQYRHPNATWSYRRCKLG